MKKNKSKFLLFFCTIGLNLGFLWSEVGLAFLPIGFPCQEALIRSEAIERNKWMRKCEGERMYRACFQYGEMQKDQFYYVSYAVLDVNSGSSFIYPNDWRAPIDASADCSIPEDYFPAGLCISQETRAFVWDPEECKSDLLDQKKAEGRNQWFKKCEGERIYNEYFPLFWGGDKFEREFIGFNNRRQDQRVYVTYGFKGSEQERRGWEHWKAPTDPREDCYVQKGLVPIGLCTKSLSLPSP